MSERPDDAARDLVRRAHQTDPDRIGFDPAAGLADVVARASESDPVQPSPTVDRAPIPAVRAARDDTTRYLCAAAQLDDHFADHAIREFVEPTRAILPEPGVDVVPVLVEAVAARTRRKLRDAALLTLAGVTLLLTLWTVVLVWVVVGGVVAISLVSFRDRPVPRLVVPLVSAAAAGLGLVYVIARNPPGLEFLRSDAPTVVSLLPVVLALAVLLTDELVVWNRIRLLSRYHRLDLGLPSAPRGPLASRFLAELNRREPRQRQAAAHEHANGSVAQVIVSSGYNLFAGAGEPRRPWSLVIPLRKRPDVDVEIVPLTTEHLYEAIGREIDGLRHGSRGPGRRFAHLEISEQIVVTAEGLIDHLAEPTTRDFLSGPTAAPYTAVSGERARELRDDPLEWARYYLRFQLELWDRDVVVSAFLHLTVDANTVYVEWVPCVLRPIRSRYRQIDTMSTSPLRPAGRALLRLVTLPVTLPQLLYQRMSPIRPRPRKPGVISPGVYGARYSLRELAADNEFRNIFQAADQERYLKTLESRMVGALTDALRRRGYATESLEREAMTRTTTADHRPGPLADEVRGPAAAKS